MCLGVRKQRIGIYFLPINDFTILQCRSIFRQKKLNFPVNITDKDRQNRLSLATFKGFLEIDIQNVPLLIDAKQPQQICKRRNLYDCKGHTLFTSMRYSKSFRYKLYQGASIWNKVISMVSTDKCFVFVKRQIFRYNDKS